MNSALWTPELGDYLERRLMFALTRFTPRIRRVEVHLEDQHGPHGRIANSCRIVVRLRGLPDSVATTLDTEWKGCIDLATTRIGTQIQRTLVRERQQKPNTIESSSWRQ